MWTLFLRKGLFNSSTPLAPNSWSVLFVYFNRDITKSILLLAGTASKPVFSKEIIASIFTPTLDDVGQKSIQSLSFFDPFSPWNEGMQWSTALGVNLKDWPGRRKKGSGNCE